MNRAFSFCLLLATTLGPSMLLAACAPKRQDEPIGEARQRASQGLGGELEPNDAAGTASPIGSDAVVRAHIFPVTSDVDWFAFQAAPGDQVFAATMTSASTSGSDTTMELIAPDGTTGIESDLDDGSLSSLSSSIAGGRITQAGTHFIRILSSGTTIRPYDLHFKLQSSAPTPEVEPNDFTPNLLPASGFVSGSLSAQTDYDFFSFQLEAGDSVFASLDLDPTRDGTEWDGRLLFGPLGPTNTSLVVDDAGGAAGPDSEAIFATVKSAGVYRVGVTAPASAMMVGDYALSVSIHPATAASANCTTYTSTDLAQPIPPDPGEVTSTLMVPGSPRIADIDVSLTLSHTNPPDLDIYLVSPAGNTNALVTNVGGANFPNWDFTLDDEAAFPAGLYTLNNAMVMQPESVFRLDWFKGENAGGTWTLHVVDDAATNGGTLQGWSITICEPPVLTCTDGTVPVSLFSTDFESGPAGFTHMGGQDEWALGMPVFPPVTGCNSGTSCFKTDLTGTYNPGSTQDLISAPIDLAGMAGPIELTWAMKYQLDSASFDHAWVEVREVGGANARHVWESTGAVMQTPIGNPAVTLDESAGWGVHTADIGAYAGKMIEVVFHLDSNTAGQYGGLAVDDVAVTGCRCGNGTVDPGEQCDDGDTTDGDGCDSNCTPTGCGNGIVTSGEECDDGNMVDGDGCASDCTMETTTGAGGGGGTTSASSGSGSTSSSSTGSSSTGTGGGSTTGTGGAGTGGAGTGGAGTGGAGTGGAASGGGGAGGNGTSSGSTGFGDGSDLIGSEGGCNCSVPGKTHENTSLAALGLLGLLAARLRRPRNRALTGGCS